MKLASPFLMLALLGAAGLVDAAPKAPAPEWPMFKGGPQRRGVGPALGLPVQELWRAKLKGSLYSSPVVSQGLVVLGSSSKHVYALDLATGDLRWSRELPDRIWGSGPAVDQGRVFIGCVDGCVHALDLLDGAVLGSYCAQRKGFFGERPDVLSSPLVVGGRLFFGSDNYDIYGWDLSGRRDQWRFETRDILHDNSAAWAAGRVFFPSRDATLYALDESDGRELWRYTTKKGFNTVPACDEAAVYLGDAAGVLHSLDQASGALRWSFTAKRGIMSSPALGRDGSVVFGSADDRIYNLDAATGALRWVFKSAGPVLASPVITGGMVWIGSYDDSFYALDLATGEPLWSTKLEGGIFTSAAVAGDKIVVAGRDGDLICLVATAVSNPPSPR